jgi:hypothetical protein
MSSFWFALIIRTSIVVMHPFCFVQCAIVIFAFARQSGRRLDADIDAACHSGKRRIPAPSSISVTTTDIKNLLEGLSEFADRCNSSCWPGAQH